MSTARLHDRSPGGRIFRDRREAGRVLAGLLGGYRGRAGLLVLGLARGGIPMAWEVAAALGDHWTPARGTRRTELPKQRLASVHDV